MFINHECLTSMAVGVHLMVSLDVAVVLPCVVVVVDVLPPLLWLPSSTIHLSEHNIITMSPTDAV